MKNVFFLLFISLPAFAGDLSGVWKIDKEKTEEFNSKYAVQKELAKYNRMYWKCFCLLLLLEKFTLQRKT
jgi:hypothetical protein